MNRSLRALGAYFGSLVHPSARDDVVGAARQQSFIAAHLLAGLLALCVLPLYLSLTGTPTLLDVVAFLWFLTPIGVAIFLSRTGRFGAAHLISAANFTGLITFSAWLTGGITSFLIPWMVVVLLEASLSSDRRVVAWAAGLASLGLIALAAGGAFGLVPQGPTFPVSANLLGLFGAMSATVYAAGLAITVQLVHRRSEDAIRVGEERYRLLAENATDMITRHDEKGRVLFVSQASQQLLGEAPEKLTGDGLFERVHVADRPAYLTALSRCSASGEPVTVEFRVRQQDPSGLERYSWVEMRCRPLQTSLGGAYSAGVLAGTRDISLRKAQEDELTRARDEAESASRAKTQFLANMSHELRTPLNAVIGFSEILNRELFGALGEQRYRDYARMIHESGEHLLHVVNDILDMSKIETGKLKLVKEPFDVGSLIASCTEVMWHAAEAKQLTLVTEVAPGMPELIADKRACKQMLLNVISNAIKFTDAGGSVRVAAREEDGMVELIVADTGIGIAEQDLPKLGNPFVQADNAYNRSHEGAGLGLSVVKGLARLHGGRLEIASELGHGTTTTILLPLGNARGESGDALGQGKAVTAA
ncbi:MAG TPA: PAS domain-containing sensor histidine kinase [Methyloceanibacter sp.]|nr:PAS domain-containing sensor histidine kinase [Methyloceanibacter sp.]